MPSHLVVEALSAMAHLSYPQVNTERQLTAWAEKGVLIFLITVLMIVFAAIMLIESWYLLSHRKTGIFGQAATERSFRHCSIWGWLLLIWGIVSLIAAFFSDHIGLVATVLVIGCLADMAMALATSSLVFKKH